jgi:predicted DCC family thiol-disulfide oxidoreductase YuxK
MQSKMAISPVQHTVIYDGNCNLCVTLVQLLEKLDQGHLFLYLPMQDAEGLAQFGITPADCEMGMILVKGDQRWQGSQAAEEIARLLPMGAVFIQAYRALPGMKPLGDGVYAQVRDNRYTLFGKRSTTYQSSYPVCVDCRV